MPRGPLLITDLSGRRFPGAGARPFTWLAGGLALLLLVDLMVGATRSRTEPALADDLGRARAAMVRAREDDQGWLLLGDSVLAGDVMRGRVERWTEHRVLDYLRREQREDAGVGFTQIALDGMLPVDMLQALRELDTLDPAGRVGVVVEINPRFFSAHYADQRECSRPFLCELGPTHEGRWRWGWVPIAGREAWRWLGDHLPVVRHRDAFPRWGAEQAEALLPRPGGSEASPDDPLLGRARILEHYRDPQLNRSSVQYRALQVLVQRLRRHGRRALLFATPLKDRFMAGTLDAEGYGRYVAGLDHLINRPGDARIRFLSLDHPALHDEHFIDHAHLEPEGNRWLAINLLHQLGIGLGREPPRGTLAYPEGPDQSLVARIDRGYSDGAPWQAALRRPLGIAVAPGGERIVIADTGNHCLREVVGPATTLRTLAGRADEEGHADGRREQARFVTPRWPVLLGDRVYVLDGKRRLREVGPRMVRTLHPAKGPRWRRLDRLRAQGRHLWLLDGGTRVLRFDPAARTSEVWVEAPGAPLVAFDVGPDGRLYLADEDGRLWQHSPGDPQPVLLFANNATELLPQDKDDYFPFRFDEIALHRVFDLRYVDRYDGLLVQDDHGTERHRRTVTERIHLRLISLADRRVYPWLKPLAHGGGYMFRNRHTGALSSVMHQGTMALDPGSVTLFYMERERSRLLRLSDGLLGVSKLGHHITPITYGGLKDVFGLAAGKMTTLLHHPERWVHRRLERVPRRGPYLGLMLGSSMTSVTDLVGQYSLARVIERSLVRTLGVRDGLRFDLVQRAFRGPRLGRLISNFEAAVEHQAPVDVVLFELHSGRMYTRHKQTAAMVMAIDRIRRVADRHDTLVVLLDNDAMTSSRRDGLRGSRPYHRQFLALAEDAGFVVLRPGDQLLRDAIDHSPWGNAPFVRPHGSTWAVDLTGEWFAQALYPALAEHLRDRVPALMQPPATEPAPVERLHGAFGRERERWVQRAATVPPQALQRSLEGRRVEVLVDLDKGGYAPDLSEPQRDEIVLGALVVALIQDPAGRLGSTVQVSLARFSSYDEYGVGVLDSATIVERRELDRTTLEQFLDRMSQTTAVPKGR